MRGFTFSWKRAIGISGLKSRLAHGTGIPTTRMGLERKIGASILNTTIGIITFVFGIIIKIIPAIIKGIIKILR